jgi:hypothetical protein
MEILPKAPARVFLEQIVECIDNRSITVELTLCGVFTVPSPAGQANCSASLRDRQLSYDN